MADFTKSQTDLVCIKYPSTIQFAEKRQWVQHCVNLVVEKAVEHYQVYLKLVQQRVSNPNKISVNEILKRFRK
ncbi:exodeoxyribonuclease V subunit alpha [Actinobacillus equuli]|nr:exodeoxyribonuclease V subunit alpha [Actinobacillus equuli]